MVNAGLAPITVVDDYLAEFWKQVLTNITVHRDVPLRSGGRLAVAFRKDNPELRNAVNVWLGSTERATPSETWSNVGISEASST